MTRTITSDSIELVYNLPICVPGGLNLRQASPAELFPLSVLVFDLRAQDVESKEDETGW